MLRIPGLQEITDFSHVILNKITISEKPMDNYIKGSESSSQFRWFTIAKIEL